MRLLTFPLGRCLLAVCLLASWLIGHAGELTREALARRFEPPLHVGERLRDIPAWPITSELEPDAGPVGYVFESIDLAPIPGFEGTPINLLVAIDRHGSFMDVDVLRQHEPVFLSGLGEAPLHEFVRQYRGKGLKQEITVSTVYGGGRGGGDNRVVLDGVTKATASVRIVNQSVLTAALAVARARLGFAASAQRGPVAEVRSDAFEKRSFNELLASGAIGRLHLTHGEAEKLFAGSEGAGIDPVALAHPGATFVDLYVAYLNAPTVGRAILGDAAYAELMRMLEPGQHAYWVASAGRDSFIDDSFVRGTVPQRLAFAQGGLPIELRDADRSPPQPAGAPALNAALVLRTPPLSGLDPAGAVRFSLTISRARGSMLAVVTHRRADLDYTAPAAFFRRPPRLLPDWLIAWQERAGELAVIAAALAVLAVVLVRPRTISSSALRLQSFRLAFLAFTLSYVGWFAQGQLSIVHITGAIKSLVAGRGLMSFLYDPVSLLLIAFTLASLLVWGRGTFCGWLCPFGALQEFVARVAQRLGVPQLKVSDTLDRRLGAIKYLILAAILGAALVAPALSDKLVEAEPFKTAITLMFNRGGAALAYAVGVLAAGAVVYKSYCRWLCPLGAALAVGGGLRRWNWLARRAECGTPCQRCRHSCEYGAIERNGAIRYRDCFQCLDCVAIHDDRKRCAPLLLMDRKGRVVRTRPSSRSAAQPALAAGDVDEGAGAAGDLLRVARE